MIRPLLAACAALALSAPVMAGDNRLVSRLYKADEVVRIDGRVAVQASTGAWGGHLSCENCAEFGAGPNIVSCYPPITF